ncbi:MAG: SDR family oxidoreductase [Collinsella sp.]
MSEQLLATYPEAKVWGRTCDLADLDAVTEAFRAAAEDMGGVDTIVNNAASLSPLRCSTTRLDDWKKIMDLNVTAVFNGCTCGRAACMIEAGHWRHHHLPPAPWFPSTVSPPAAVTRPPSTLSTA